MADRKLTLSEMKAIANADVPLGIRCPQCQKYAVRVYDSRKGDGYIKRHRKCLVCGHTWKKIET